MLRIQQLRPAEAEREFRQAELISPSYALPRFQRGRLLSRAGNYAQAREELEKAISLQPNLAEAYYELALLLRRLGKSDEANQAMARFKSFRTAENNGREVILKELQETIR
jgi:Flp pilus assembly protein TadD